ncbi:cell division protein ZapB [Halodesulfovibrio marinisediminis]|uniref:Cell division protein ZapB n=1 Tax=Halodesulfovibrio marinisediminis DSM 17456 TaxID=1121457 RepID=A0A1N6FY50_9BACT|nr:cell division protein ZapB [Halodesulfovibrio marinisediminis]SIO00235.1 cell division protein ZapB [Halodesulfovibrio marinisediminis DSM 17456]
MELIDRLEQRLESLLEEIETLKNENIQLKEEVEVSLSVLEEENRSLKEELEQERSTKEAVMGRIDGLLSKLSTSSDSM